MPVGDNQHTFTCPACSLRVSRDLRCEVSGYCNACCRQHNTCARRCSCNAVFFSCQPRSPLDTPASRCHTCGYHSGCQAPELERTCRCRTCNTCNQVLTRDSFTMHGLSLDDCINCHRALCAHQSNAHCRRCYSLIGEVNPIRDCCSNCAGCCRARGCNGKTPIEYIEMPTVVDDKTGEYIPVKKLAKKTQFQFNPIKRTLGFEIETTKYSNGGAVTAAVKAIGGAIVSDGSVPQGFEINTPPMNGDVLTHGLMYLSQTLIDAGAQAASKAGLHIHVDCSDMEYADMRRMIMLYGRLESGLFSIIDSRRITGGYCKPNGGRVLLSLLSNPAKPVNDIVSMVYTRPPMKGWESWTKGKSCDGDRYWAMNVHSWFLRGTVEFRLHHGTIRWEKMMGMGMLLGAIADGALSIPEREIVDFPQGKEGLLKIAPTPWCREWVKERWAHFAKNRKNKEAPIADF